MALALGVGANGMAMVDSGNDNGVGGRDKQ